MKAMIKEIIKIGVLCTVAFTSVSVAAKDCTEAQNYFNEGMEAGKAGNWAEAKSLLQSSIDVCERFDNWYLLGQANFYSESYQEAESAYIEARKYAKHDDQIALAIARYAEARNAMGYHTEAVNLLHDARALHNDAPQWIAKLALDIDSELANQPVSGESVTRALTTLPPKSFHKYQPKYSLRLNFEYDSEKLVNPEAFDPKVIVEALKNKELEDKVFTLMGHSDVRGDENYNETLSERRARAIRQAIVDAAPDLAPRIKTLGKGETAPLYEGNSEKEHLLNRRVEIAVE
ncbi:OmpA family protein [Marinobacter sp. CHS3-4]|uniref:OmpA family protein n=1 Tax=Marinobacter sp. CHS3-4 TaxID=3045174 RepID=UPI0024B5F2B5|nr:OmpA family protein [Marinobacter sp. CHS3-4]MDI9245949.1 OmpA family protein [Marinobacter sp. CHS3-4]